MAAGYALPRYEFRVPAELASGSGHRSIVIVGAGLSGLTLACDLAARRISAVVVDDDDTVGVRGAASRGICYAQKSLEVFDRLGIYERIKDKGVIWSVGKTLAGEDEVYSFNLEVAGHSSAPPFINLQQFHVESFLVDRIAELGHVEFRWKNRVTSCVVERDAVNQRDRACLTITTPAGDYLLTADWVVDASGAASSLREGLALDTHEARGRDRWCISDVRFAEPAPAERRTWIEAPFNEGRAVWQHPMADGVWRLDYQMAPDADPVASSTEAVVRERLTRQFGPDAAFELVWVGPYAYRTHCLDRFVHRNVIFIGDAAHCTSPFGARGGNSGIQDADNLGWKLALLAEGAPPEPLLASYSDERHAAATTNIEVTRRTTRFLAPQSETERIMRRAVLGLAREHPFARRFVNTGRMSVANAYPMGPGIGPGGGTCLPNIAIVDSGGNCSRLVDLQRGALCWVVVAFEDATVAAPMSGTIRLVRIRRRDNPILVALANVQADSVLLVRPDQYLALHLRGATWDDLAAFLGRIGASTDEAAVP